MRSLKPDVEDARSFLGRLTGNPNSIVTFQTFYEGADREKKPSKLNRVLHGPLSKHVATLEKLNSAGAGIFVMVNEGDGIIHDGEKTCRTKRNVIRVRALFVDLDGAPIEPVIGCNPPPDIVVSSSPDRYHAYWTGWDCSLEDFKRAQKALIQKFNADPSVHDLPRVMRLPGFYHNKGAPYLVRLLP